MSFEMMCFLAVIVIGVGIAIYGAIKVNGGVKPKLYTPSRYESGSSISHLDEASFSMTGLNSVMTPSLDCYSPRVTPRLIAKSTILRLSGAA